MFDFEESLQSDAMTKPNAAIFETEIDRTVVPALKVHPMVVGADGADRFAGGVADMDFAPPQCVLDAMAGRLEHGVFGYETVPSDLFGNLIGWFEKRHQWAIDEKHILRAPNILNTLSMALNAFTKKGEGVIIQPPVFFDFYDILDENDRRVVENNLRLVDGRYEVDFDDLEQKASDPNNTMIYLCNPHNPVGRVWSSQELTRIGDICVQHGVLVVSDEIHGDITFKDHPYTPFASLGADYADNAIVCLSPAKSFNIAACCSAFTIVADQTRRERLQAENSRLTVNKNNAFASVAMSAAYGAGGPWVDELMGHIAGNLELVRKRFETMALVDLIEPEGTFLLWVDFRALKLSQPDLVKFLREDARWAITNGGSFGKEGEGFMRLNLACTRKKLNWGLDVLERALTQFETS